MRRLFWLGAVVSAFLLSSCGRSEKKTPPQDVIGDEEYRVMSAVLKNWMDEREEYRPSNHSEDIGFKFDRAESLRIARQMAAEDARADSLYRRFGRLAFYVYIDTSHSPEFFDTLIMRFGRTADGILRDSVNGKVAYDSLHRKYGDLSYYVTVDRNTLENNPAGSPIFYEKEAASKLSPDLIQSFNAINLVSHELDRERFTDSLVVELISREDVDSALSPREWWPAFYERYPLSDGTFGISRVGFNSDTTLALLRIVVVSGRLSGIGWLSLLEKKDGRWIVVAEQVDLRI